MKTVDLASANVLCSNLKLYYTAFQRGGWYLPDFKSGIITKAYLEKIRDKTYWAPRIEDIKLRNCTDPPKK